MISTRSTKGGLPAYYEYPTADNSRDRDRKGSKDTRLTRPDRGGRPVPGVGFRCAFLRQSPRRVGPTVRARPPGDALLDRACRGSKTRAAQPVVDSTSPLLCRYGLRASQQLLDVTERLRRVGIDGPSCLLLFHGSPRD